MTYQETELIKVQKARIAVSMRQVISQLILDVDFTDFGYIKSMLDGIEKVSGIARVPNDGIGEYNNAQFAIGRQGDERDMALTMIEQIKAAMAGPDKLVDQAQTMLELSENAWVAPAIRVRLQKRANRILEDLDKQDEVVADDAPGDESLDAGDEAQRPRPQLGDPLPAGYPVMQDSRDLGELTIERIEELISTRRALQVGGNIESADALESKLLRSGIVIFDGSSGTTWRRAAAVQPVPGMEACEHGVVKTHCCACRPPEADLVHGTENTLE